MHLAPSTRRWLCLGVGLAVIGGLLFCGRPRPLPRRLPQEPPRYQATAPLRGALPQKQPDGSVAYIHPGVNLTAAPGHPAVQALAEALGQLSCRRRLRLPMEVCVLYRTGADSLSITLQAEDQLVDLHLLSDSSTLYDLASNRAYRVEDGSFAVLKEVVETYGVSSR